MRLGLYIIASIILMAIVGSFVFSIYPEISLSIKDLGVSSVDMKIPLAVWIILPMFVLMVASVLHMMFYGTKNFFKFKKWENDSNTLTDALYWALLNEPKTHKFNLPQLKQTASLLSVSTIKVNGKVENSSEKLGEALAIVSAIESGEYVDLKAKKLSRILSSDNPLVKKNILNRLEKDETFAEEVIQDKLSYDETIFKIALNKFAKTTTFPQAQKYLNLFDKESFLTLISRVTDDDDLGLTKDILDKFIVELESSLECGDYLQISTLMMKRLSPDENLMVWKEYQSKYSKAEIAYLYLLFEYEMIDKAGDYLREHGEDDFKRFRALYELKKEDKKYKITDMMNIRHICDA
jgi:ABC-type multidrug transport system fused ATPase/permease subunit